MDVDAFVLELKDGEPAEIPVPTGCPFKITGAHAVKSVKKIVLEAIIQVVRLDRLNDDTDVAPTDILDTTLAVILPEIKPDVTLNLNFSQLNFGSLRAQGGDLIVTGIYNGSTEDELC